MSVDPNFLKKQTIKGESVWVAPNATLVGNINLGHECTVLFGAVIRADNDEIKIGNRSNIQDNPVLHVDPGCPVHIGNDCIIGHGAIVHGAKLGNHVLVGMNATILNNATIGNYCIIGANALIPEGMQIPDGSLVVGMPGRVIKQLTEEQKDTIRQQIPLDRLGVANDVAGACVFLASDLSAYCTGITLDVNGGMLIH